MGNPFGEVNVQPVTVSQQVFEILKAAIIQGRLAPGARLVEVELAQMLGVSRTPLREAILRLEHEGWLERQLNGGVQVAPLLLDEVEQTYQARAALEGIIARQAVERITPEQLAELEMLTELMAARQSTGKLAEMVTLGKSFHQIIHEASGNRVCVQLLRMLNDRADRYKHLSVILPGRAERAALEHRRLLECFKARHPRRAEAEMRRHVLDAGRRLVQAIRSSKNGKGE